MNALMDLTTNCEFVSAPIDGLGDGGSPVVSELKVFHERWAMGGIPDRGLIVVGDGTIVDLQLGTSMGK
jgi:hypothetical protein